MKKLLLLIFILLASQLFAQVSGKSKPGRLFQKKKIISEKITEPKIFILDPILERESFISHEQKLTIHGKIEDDYGIKTATINNSPLGLISNNEFYHEARLNRGSNRFIILAINDRDKQTQKIISIEFVPKSVAEPKIVVIEPNFNSINEFNTDKTNIIVRGRIENYADIESFSINNNLVNLSSDGQFYFDLKLNVGLNPLEIAAASKEIGEIKKNYKIIRESVITVPIITIIEPALPPSNELRHNETIITIRGKIESSSSISSISVNNQSAALLGENEFFANISLNDGINNIVVKAINVKGVSSEKIFRILTPVDDKGPEISIIEPTVSRGLKIVRKKDVLKVRGKVSDRSGILNVTVNNREVSLLPNREFSAQLYLGLGDNTIIIRATDRKYNVTIDTFYVTRKLDEVIKTGRYIALIIGINSYQGYWHPLSNAVNDARGLAETLRRDYYFNEIHTLIDKEATRKNIIQKLEWIINNSTSDDNILIFYAGHGQFKRSLNKGYWVPVDATSNSTADYISNNDIKTFIGGIPSKHTLLITDACFAGDIFRGRKTETIPFDPSDMTKYYREVYNKPSRLALTSGSLEQVSDAGKDNHSIFTYFLLKSLSDNSEKYLDASQLFNDFRMAVTNNSDQTPQLQVIRDTNDEGGQFIFIKKEK